MHVIAFIYVKATNRKYVSIDNIFAVTDTAVKVSKQEILSQIVFVETVLEYISIIREVQRIKDGNQLLQIQI